MREYSKLATWKRIWWSAVAAVGVPLVCCPLAVAGCKLGKMLELPVTMVDMHPMVTVNINGTEAQFIADSGAFYSMMTPAGAAALNLKTYPAPWGLRVNGLGGEASGLSAATVKDFMLVNVPIHNIEFLVGGGDVGGGGVGLLGQNVFRIGDVEYDLAHGAIRLMHEDGCRNALLAYWATATQPVSMIEIGDTTPLEPHTTGVAFINGVKIRVMFDTGAYASLLTKKAAVRAGINLDSTDVVEAGESRGIGRSMVKTWIARIASFKMGDEEIRNTKLRISDSEVGYAEMLIGADFFLSHRVYVASKQRKLFFTYNGGRVFNLAGSPQGSAPPPAASPGDALPGPAIAADGSAGTPPAAPAAETSQTRAAAANEPQDAAEFSRRGSAFAARHDYEHAIADLNRACDLAPDNPDYLYQRGSARLMSNNPAAARADFDRAIALKADHPLALLARADLELRDGQTTAAAVDLDTVARTVEKQSDVRLSMAREYARADLLPSAAAQLDLWIAAHRDDSRLPEAQLERCWVRALSGQDLRDALKDCDAAFKRVDKSSETSARILASRGLVRLRLGEYDKSMADFSESLGRRPKDPWALYGRGIDEIRRGLTSQGKSDMAAATALWAPIAEKYLSHGVPPPVAADGPKSDSLPGPD